MTLWGTLQSQIVRFHRSPLLWFHITSALILPLLCGFYFAVSPWNPLMGTDAYVQTLGALMPLAICIVIAFDIEIERQAGELTTLLAAPSRALSMLGKLFAYALLGLATLAACYAIFIGILSGYGRDIPSLSSLTLSCVVLWLGSLLLYPFALWSALKLGRNVTIAIGAVLSAIAILSLGGLAHGLVSRQLTAAQSPTIVYALPMAWPTRMGSLALEHGINAHVSLQPLLTHTGIALASVLILTAILCVWIGSYEDRKREF
ncbi:ABC transporter permease [Alloscardovia venturai]|uniref:ABC transporter permease n=1 Tax=Alloscardovia venturai TaxID=1769421 RepID=A0ABW2Y4Y1_9BIFI